jgi:peptide/nickel transport system permease protein
MATFILRRLVVSFFVLLAATFLVYVLVANAGDPRTALLESADPSREAKIAALTENLNLDTPVIPRYFGWLGGVAGCFIGQCDLGTNINGAPVTGLLSVALGSTLRLVLFATVVAILFGVTVGIVTALRQYSGLDYSTTFLAFLFFSLPAFWIAVLLKQFLAIKFNSWLGDPVIPLWLTIVLAALGGLLAMALLGGDRRQRLLSLLGGAAVIAAICVYLDVSKWFAAPGIGPVVMILGSLAAAVGATALLSGFRYRRVLVATLITAVIGIVCYFSLGWLLDISTLGTILILGLVTMAVSAAIGLLVGGVLRSQAVKACMITGFLAGALIFADRLLQAVPGYSDKVRGILIATIGSNTPNFSGDFWETTLDQLGHLLLPSIVIVLISFATYTRYTRSSMLETMNQDYVRTARAKGLTERTVVVRHAFRNAMIPVTTLMAIDFGAVIGGAVITETVFGWQGMGRLFTEALRVPDPNPVMGFFLVTGTAVVVFNMIVDILYGVLDPRIRTA